MLLLGFSRALSFSRFCRLCSWTMFYCSLFLSF